MKHDSMFIEWIRCPECGYDEFEFIPPLRENRNTYITCPECEHTGVRVG